jgi:lysophospholipase L1-like esterase
MKKQISCIVALLLVLNFAWAQERPPFWNEIQNFKHQDSLKPPPSNAILFVGSSSFRMWKGLQDSFPAYTLINRGFGGSTLVDVIRYEDDIIFKYDPKQIVIYCGENDVAASDTVTGQVAFERFKQLYSDIRKKYPRIPIAFVSLKPSPLRWSKKDRMVEANRLIKDFIKNQKNTRYIDVWNPMIGEDGRPMENLFIHDMLHMNEKGYAIWTKLIEPVLVK